MLSDGRSLQPAEEVPEDVVLIDQIRDVPRIQPLLGKEDAEPPVDGFGHRDRRLLPAKAVKPFQVPEEERVQRGGH